MTIGKMELLEAIAPVNRGLLASESDKQAILAAIARLEEHNPTSQPLEATELLDGNWLLLYTTSQDLLGIDRFPLAKLGAIYQCIRTQRSKLYNIAEVETLPFLEGLVSVTARFEPSSQRRVNVFFQRSIIGLQRAIGYTQPNDLIRQIEQGQSLAAIDISLSQNNDNATSQPSRNRQGWLEVTYLDEDLRIGRGNEGSVFVLKKVPS
jgi:hypothetical protein